MKRYASNMRGLGQFGTVGMEMVLSVLAGLWIGYKIDGWLHTDPWFTVIWFFFGCGAAAKAVHRAWKDMQREAKREEAIEGNPIPAFPDEKALAWQREEERKQRAIRDASKESSEDASDAALEAEVEKLSASAKPDDPGAKNDG